MLTAALAQANTKIFEMGPSGYRTSDREFWLQLAHRWEALSQGRKDAEVPKDPYSQGSRKAIFKPRRAA